MSRFVRRIPLLATLIASIAAGTVQAQTTYQKCEAAMLRHAGRYALCRLNEERKAALAGTAPDHATCEARFEKNIRAAQKKYGSDCPPVGDTPELCRYVKNQADAMAAAMAGDLPRGFPSTGQTTCWENMPLTVPCAGTGQDGELRAGAPLQYIDNGDGTITDVNTGLMWEKLSDDGGLHDKDNTYTWQEAVYIKVAALNTEAFAGYTDWRLPNVRELQSLVHYENIAPSMAAAFHTNCLPACEITECSCTESLRYWTSTSSTYSPYHAWFVYFGDGTVFWYSKLRPLYVRAVRAGLLGQ